MTESAKKNSYLLAFVIWATLSAFYFYQFIARSSFITVLNEEFMQYFNIDTTGIGFLGSCYYVIYTIMQIPAGIIVDKFSTKLVAVLACAICTLGLFVLVVTPNSFVAGFGEMLMGFGSSFAFLLIVKAITQWFPPEKIAIMTSFAMSLGCLGPVAGNPLVASLVKYFNWLDVIKVYCLVGVGLTFLIWMIVQDKNEDTKVDTTTEEIDVIQAVKRILCSGQAWVLGLMTMAVYAPLSTLGDLWGVRFIKANYDFSSQVSANIISQLYLGVVIGSPIIAYIATKIGSFKKPMIFGVIGAMSCLSAVIYLNDFLNMTAVFILMFSTGFFCGSMLAYPLGLALFPKSLGATITGFINMMSMVSGVVLMPTVGTILKYVWNGTVENGTPVYSALDFKYGLSPVIAFLLFGTLLSYFIKDKSPKEAN